jgi:imidazolonepropionase-like amidohydrolase
MKRTRAGFWISGCLALILSGSLAPLSAQDAEPVLVISGGTLIDGLGGAPLENAVIVIEGNRISAVGAEGDVAVPNGAQMLDASGKYILPGLIDGKSNWSFQYGEAYLNWGVTSAIVSGGRNDQGIADRDAINHGVFAGPRLFQAVVGIRGPGPGLDGRQGYAPGSGDITPYSPEDARQYTRDVIAAGADFIVIGDGNGPIELWRPVVEEAHAAGLAVSCRCMGPQMRGLEAAEIGVDVMVHFGNIGASITTDPERWANAGNTAGGGPEPTGASDPFATMDEAQIPEAIQLLIENNAYLSPEFVALDRGFYSSADRVREEGHALFDDPDLRAYYSDAAVFDLFDNVRPPEEYLSPETIAERGAAFLKKAEFARRFVEAGGKLVASSDITQAAPGLGVHQEMAIMQEDVRMPQMKIIQAATKWNADAHRLGDIGSVEAGKLADILIVNADPLDDIMNTRDIHMVIKDGEIWEFGYDPDYGGRLFANSLVSDDRSVVEGGDWAQAVRGSINRRDVLAKGAPAPAPRISPTPAIDAITPRTIVQNSSETIVSIHGVSFVQRSKVFMGEIELPTEVVSNDVIRATLSEEILAEAGKLKLVVKNPLPVSDPVWGDVSNAAYVLVPFEFTTTWFSKVHDESKYIE